MSNYDGGKNDMYLCSSSDYHLFDKSFAQKYSPNKQGKLEQTRCSNKPWVNYNQTGANNKLIISSAKINE